MCVNFVVGTMFPGWGFLWSDLADSGCSWESKQPHQNVEAVESTIEQMLRTSIPANLLTALHERWGILPKRKYLSIRGSADTLSCLNVSDGDKSQTTDKEVEEFYRECIREEDAKDADSVANCSKELQEMVRSLLQAIKLTALVTIYEFFRQWPRYLMTLPVEVFAAINDALFGIAFAVVMSELC